VVGYGTVGRYESVILYFCNVPAPSVGRYLHIYKQLEFSFTDNCKFLSINPTLSPTVFKEPLFGHPPTFLRFFWSQNTVGRYLPVRYRLGISLVSFYLYVCLPYRTIPRYTSSYKRTYRLLVCKFSLRSSHSLQFSVRWSVKILLKNQFLANRTFSPKI